MKRNDIVLKKNHIATIRPSYTSFHHPKPNLTLNGAALIHKFGVLQLTNETNKLKGHAFYPSPIQFKNSTTKTISSFSTCFSFSIHPEYPKFGSHGFAFAVAPNNQLNSSLPSQYHDLLNSTNVDNFSNHIFVVEFPTIQEFEFGDINDNHVGVDVNSLASNASITVAYFNDDLKYLWKPIAHNWETLDASRFPTCNLEFQKWWRREM